MKAVFVGACTLDHVGLVESLLNPGQREEMSTFSIQGSGSAANSAVVCARWGGEVSFVGKVGDDHRGRQIERTLAEEGITTDGVVRQPEAVSQFSFRAVEHGTGRSEQMFTRGTVGTLSPGEARLPADLDLVVTDGSQPEYLEWLLGQLREEQPECPVVLNAGESVPGLERFVDEVDYVIVPEPFASRYTGVGRLEEMGGAMLDCGLSGVVLTLGADGVYGTTPTSEVRDEGLSVELVDPEGAQDTFAGVFAYGQLAGWSFEKMVKRGVAAGDLVKTELGSRRYIPTESDVQSR